jgi:uncharacterized protein YidB (DUF937 family)
MGALDGALGGLLSGGGLDKVLDGFEQSGMGDKVESWIGTGANEALSSDQVKRVLANDQIAAVADKLGVTPDQASDAIAEALPELVDKVSPDGKLPGGVDLDDALAKLSDSTGQ